MLGGISIWQLLILLLVVVLIFGTKKLRTIGTDLGSAIKDFKKAMHEEENKKSAAVDACQIEEKSSQPSTENVKDKEQA